MSVLVLALIEKFKTIKTVINIDAKVIKFFDVTKNEIIEKIAIKIKFNNKPVTKISLKYGHNPINAFWVWKKKVSNGNTKIDKYPIRPTTEIARSFSTQILPLETGFEIINKKVPSSISSLMTLEIKWPKKIGTKNIVILFIKNAHNDAKSEARYLITWGTIVRISAKAIKNSDEMIYVPGDIKIRFKEYLNTDIIWLLRS